MNHKIGFFHGNVMIHVIKHDIDPNSNINYSRKIGPEFQPNYVAFLGYQKL